MTVPIKHSFRVRHEPKDQTCWITDPSDAVVGAIDIGGVAEGNQIRIDLVVVGQHKPTFGVGVGESAHRWVGEIFEFLGPDAVGIVIEFHDGPVVDESAMFVLAKCDRGVAVVGIGIGIRIAWEESELCEDLEAVADADDGCASVAGGDEFWEKMLAGVHGFDSA